MAETIVKHLIRRRTLLLLVVPLLAMLAARPRPLFYLLGVALVAAGQSVRLWAAGYLVKQEQLATTGPYACVRNPLYLGSLLITLGWSAMSGRIELAVLLLGAYFLTHWPTIRSEERYLQGRYGAEFAAYCRRVPRLIPRPARARGAAGSFSWQRVVRGNNELVSAVGVALLAVAFGIRLWV